MGISLVTTVRNEEHSIVHFLNSIKNQTRVPDEVVVVDGCSSDRTAQLVLSYEGLNIKCLVEECNIARGRNIAISNATQDIIAVTDGGCILDRKWVERITYFDAATDAIVGNYKPIIRNEFDACQYSLIGLFSSEATVIHFPISSRSLALRKSVWEEIGGYPELLNYSEDRYFHEQMLKRGYGIRLAMDAVVEWEQRHTLKAVYRQFFRYMEGDGMARMNTKKHVARFVTYLAGLALLFGSMYNGVFFLPLCVGLLLYVSVPCSAFVRLGRYRLLGRALVMIPALLIIVDIAKMAGYLTGLAKPIRMRGCQSPGCAVQKSVEI